MGIVIPDDEEGGDGDASISISREADDSEISDGARGCEPDPPKRLRRDDPAHPWHNWFKEGYLGGLKHGEAPALPSAEGSSSDTEIDLMRIAATVVNGTRRYRQDPPPPPTASRKGTKLREWTERDMESAIKEVLQRRRDGMTLDYRGVAGRWKVPVSTLNDRIKGNQPAGMEFTWRRTAWAVLPMMLFAVIMTQSFKH